MTTPTNHWKLGLFVVLGTVMCLLAVVFYGGRTLQRESVSYKSYFDESVQGLDVGAPVKFRGVSIGTVADISLAGDKRHVEVTCELGVRVLNSLGLAAEKLKGAHTRLVIPPDLRVQLGTSGITGVKFIQLDFFDIKTNPPLPLPFDVPANYIPAAPSMMKNVEDSVAQAVDKFPEVVQQMVLVLTQLSTLVADFERVHVPEKLAAALGLLNQVLEKLTAAIEAADTAALSSEVKATLKHATTALVGIQQVVGRIDGDQGLAVSVQRTSEALGDLAQNANQVGPELESTLKELRGAAHSIQRLTDALELDPDMLLKGRGKRATR